MYRNLRSSPSVKQMKNSKAKSTLTTINPPTNNTMQNTSLANLDNSIAQATQYLAQKEADLFAVPVVAVTVQALVAAGDGLQAVWTSEMENKFGQSVMFFLFDIFKVVVLPLIALLWLAITETVKALRDENFRREVATVLDLVAEKFQVSTQTIQAAK